MPLLVVSIKSVKLPLLYCFSILFFSAFCRQYIKFLVCLPRTWKRATWKRLLTLCGLIFITTYVAYSFDFFISEYIREVSWGCHILHGNVCRVLVYSLVLAGSRSHLVCFLGVTSFKILKGWLIVLFQVWVACIWFPLSLVINHCTKLHIYVRAAPDESYTYGNVQAQRVLSLEVFCLQYLK